MAWPEVYHEVVRGLPHKLRVMRMYRYGLKELLNYSQNRQHWFPRVGGSGHARGPAAAGVARTGGQRQEAGKEKDRLLAAVVLGERA